MKYVPRKKRRIKNFKRGKKYEKDSRNGHKRNFRVTGGYVKRQYVLVP